MKWFYWTIGILVGMLILVTLAGTSLPREDAFTLIARYPQSPEKVWSVLTDYAAQPSWRLDLVKAERIADQDGRETWLLTDAHGESTPMEIVQTTAPRRLVLRFLDAAAGGEVTWTFILGPEAGGCRVLLTQKDSISNPIRRFIFRTASGTKSADGFLTNLAAKFGAPASVQ